MSAKTGNSGLKLLIATPLLAVCLGSLGLLLLLSAGANWHFPKILPEPLNFQPWLQLGSSRYGLSASLALSLLISAAVALIATPLGFLAAKHVAYHPRRKLLLALAYAPFALSPVVIGVCLLFFFHKLRLVGAPIGVILAQFPFAAAFALLFFVPFWNDERRAYEELVLNLGGNRRDAYRHALIPASRGPLLIAFCQTFLLSWFQYGLTLLIGSGKVQTLPIKVFLYVGEANTAFAATASLLLLLPPLLLLWFNHRLFGSP